MKKRLFAIFLSSALAITLAACNAGGQKNETGEAAVTQENSESKQTDNQSATTNVEENNSDPYEIAVIIKATSSDFWQYLLVGAENYAKEFPDRVHVTTYGPPSEADIDKQVGILEDVIAKSPDAIVIASTSSEATVPQIEAAAEKGIPVITIDNKVNSDKVTSFLATDNVKAAGQAADFMLEQIKKTYGENLEGKVVGVVSSIAGVQVMEDRVNGFIDRLNEIAPEIKIIEPQYCDNDMTKAMSITEDMITANADLVGIYGGNNITGSGVSRVVGQREMTEKITVVAFDSDAEEVEGLKSGAIKGLVVQDPYGMGYQGVDFAFQALQGEEVASKVDTPVSIVTKENMDKEEIQGLLDPYLKKK